MPSEPTIEYCDDLDAGIAEYVSRGYQLDMIVPADSPTAAQLSVGGNAVWLVYSKPNEPRPAKSDNWVTGRAGMEYRDLLPDRLGGRLIASHIRLTTGGLVPDYVHYHIVRFQMIYCLSGGVSVVYEDQGPPFWLMPGDCVLQPPEIRHRVLEALAGSEVIEVGVPAAHETWVEHEIRLPTTKLDPTRDFGGQRFVRHIAANAESPSDAANGSSTSVTAIGAATGGFADVRVISLTSAEPYITQRAPADGYTFLCCLEGEIKVGSDGLSSKLARVSAMVVPPGTSIRSTTGTASILAVTLCGI